MASQNKYLSLQIDCEKERIFRISDKRDEKYFYNVRNVKF